MQEPLLRLVHSSEGEELSLLPSGFYGINNFLDFRVYLKRNFSGRGGGQEKCVLNTLP